MRVAKNRLQSGMKINWCAFSIIARTFFCFSLSPDSRVCHSKQTYDNICSLLPCSFSIVRRARAWVEKFNGLNNGNLSFKLFRFCFPSLFARFSFCYSIFISRFFAASVGRLEQFHCSTTRRSCIRLGEAHTNISLSIVFFLSVSPKFNCELWRSGEWLSPRRQKARNNASGLWVGWSLNSAAHTFTEADKKQNRGI